MTKTKSKTNVARVAGQLEIIRASDARIANAKLVLSASGRGLQTMAELKRFMEGGASGLDSIGGKALLTLVTEFVKNHRRGFIS